MALIVLFLLVAYGTISSWHAFSTVSLGEVSSPVDDAATSVPGGFAYAIIFANALTWISLSYSGFNAAVYMTDEIDSPRRNLPRAMVLATV